MFGKLATYRVGIPFISVLFLALTFLLVVPSGASAKTKLTKVEVQQIFIDKAWHGPSGVFLFRSDGTYTFQEFGKKNPAGTWSYEMLTDGTLEGNTTSYTFYRRTNGSYFYFHSRSNRNYKAIPNRSAPFN